MNNNNKLRILGISGSPRQIATEHAIEKALDIVKHEYDLETDMFTVRGKSLKFCIHCDYCVRKQMGCIHEDDMLEVYPKMDWADAWILGTPIYHGHISAQLKTVLDRTRAMVAKKKTVFENKVGMALGVGGDRNGGQEQAMHTILDFYLINEMIPVGGGVFGANFGSTFWSQDKGQQGIEEDQQGLKSMQKTIKRLVQVTHLVQKGNLSD